MFINTYKNSNFLAPEAIKGFSVLLNTLNDFCDTIEELTENDVRSSIIEWYNKATVSSIDVIRAKSQYYNFLAFSNVTISMDAEDALNYNTAEGVCFGKVKLIYIFYKDDLLQLIIILNFYLYFLFIS